VHFAKKEAVFIRLNTGFYFLGASKIVQKIDCLFCYLHPKNWGKKSNIHQKVDRLFFFMILTVTKSQKDDLFSDVGEFGILFSVVIHFRAQ